MKIHVTVLVGVVAIAVADAQVNVVAHVEGVVEHIVRPHVLIVVVMTVKRYAAVVVFHATQNAK